MNRFYKKNTKYNSEKINGFDSKKEYRRFCELKILESKNIISDLNTQVPYILCPKQEGLDFKGKTICIRREMKYIADFVYIENGNIIVEDSKGFKTEQYKRKKRLMERIYGIKIKET